MEKRDSVGVQLYVRNCKESSVHVSPCSVDCGLGERNITMTVVVPIDETGDCKEVNSTRTEVCVAEQCPGEKASSIAITSFFKIDNCVWETWSSCQWFCGTAKIEEKTRRQITDGHARNSNCDGIEKESCTLPCTGKLS